MISESLKINTTLTTLKLWSDAKIMKKEIEIGNRGLMILFSEQITTLEQKEQRR